jgi:predicted outer membrane repeat protein
VINSVFVGNISDDAGGAIYAEDDVDVAGSTFVDNSATQNGTAIYVNDRGALVGNILWGKVGSLTLAQRGQGGNAPLTYSDVEGGYPGTGNIDADPAFVSAGDFHLQQGSPCIDAGSDSAGPTLDFDGITRVCLDVSGNVAWDGCPDMGAYEYVP